MDRSALMSDSSQKYIREVQKQILIFAVTVQVNLMRLPFFAQNVVCSLCLGAEMSSEKNCNPFVDLYAKH